MITGNGRSPKQEFKRKVLGVNAHVLVLKYGTDFSEYPEVMDMARRIRGVTGTAPFVINEMMILKGNEISGVLLKGIDPNVVGTVLDLPGHMVKGSLRGLRLPGAHPPAPRREVRPGTREDPDEPEPQPEPDLAEPANPDPEPLPEPEPAPEPTAEPRSKLPPSG